MRSPTVLFLEILARLGIDPRTLATSPTHRNGRLVVGHSEATLGKLWEFFRIVDVVAAITANLNNGRVRRGQRALTFAGLDLSAGNGAYPPVFRCSTHTAVTLAATSWPSTARRRSSSRLIAPI
jgi:hypothetical protein